MAKILKEISADQSSITQSKISPSDPPVDRPALEICHLTKRYAGGQANAVDDLSFSVQPGEIFGLLGPNGAGKTTTIGALTTRIIPTKGTVHVMGINVVTDPMEVKRHISIVPQMSNLDQSLRAREVLTFHASYHGVPRAERKARADALLRELGLEKRGKDKVANFSGGMAQRLMLARALMHSPSVLFLDEPTSSLDPQSRLFLWERIRELNARGVTVLLTTHDMDEADLLCKRIAIMDHGRILVLDTVAALKKLIPSGTKLSLRVLIPEQSTSTEPSQSDIICEALRRLPNVTKVEEVAAEDQDQLPNTHLFQIYAEETASLVVSAAQAIANTESQVLDLQLSQPSLEDVFIYLTGRKLRA